MVPTMQQGCQEEILRRDTIMKEVLPDNAMWDAWEKTEAVARKGRGWYPSLDRRFLELLVQTEIDILSVEHDVQAPLPMERSIRNRDKIRRVAHIRIGRERLEAYCGRVAQAFNEYIQGSISWDGDDSDSICVINNSDEDEYRQGDSPVRVTASRGRSLRAKSLESEESAEKVEAALRSPSSRGEKRTKHLEQQRDKVQRDTDDMAVDEVRLVDVKFTSVESEGALGLSREVPEEGVKMDLS